MYPNSHSSITMDPNAAANQNLAMQQNWNQWQAYQQQLAQWQAQYGEQYQREMMQKLGYSAQPAGFPVVQPPIPQTTQAMPFVMQQPAPPPLPVSNHPNPPPPMPQQPAPPPPPPEPITESTQIQPNHHNSFHVPPPAMISSNVPISYDAQQMLIQQQQHQLAAIPPSSEEIAFDEQFRKWEDEFNNWKRLNANHPDRVAYVDYETKMEQCRTKLLERREQMRKRKMQLYLKKEQEQSQAQLQIKDVQQQQPQEQQQQQQRNEVPDQRYQQPHQEPQYHHHSNDRQQQQNDLRHQHQRPLSQEPQYNHQHSNDHHQQPPPPQDMQRQQRPQQHPSQDSQRHQPPNDQRPHQYPQQQESQYNQRRQHQQDTQNDHQRSHFHSHQGSNYHQQSNESQYQQPELTTSFSPANPNAGIPGLDLIHDEKQHSTALDSPPDNEVPTHSLIEYSDDSRDAHSTNENNDNTSNLEALSKGINHILGDPSFLSMLSNLNPNQNSKPMANHPEVEEEEQQHQQMDDDDEELPPCEYNPDEEEDQYQSDEYDGNNDPFAYDQQFDDENDADNDEPAPFVAADEPENYDQEDNSMMGYQDDDDDQQDQTNDVNTHHREESGNNFADYGNQESGNNAIDREDQDPDADYNQENDGREFENYDQPDDVPYDHHRQLSGNNPFNRSQQPAENYQRDNNAFREQFPTDNFGQSRLHVPNEPSAIAPVAFRPRQIIDYGNVSSVKPLRSSVGAQKVFDYSHQSNDTYFKPRRFVDYGHTSQHSRGGPPVNLPQFNNNHQRQMQVGPQVPQQSRGANIPFGMNNNRGGGLRHVTREEIQQTYPNKPLLQNPVQIGPGPIKANRVVRIESANLARPVIQNIIEPRPSENKQSPPASLYPKNNQQNETVINRNTVRVEDILFEPGRSNRPKKIIIIMRGPPGSGKSHLAKKIKDVEYNKFQASVRILSIDDYFTSENDDAEIPQTAAEESPAAFKYDASKEQTYAGYLMKSYKKTVLDGLFEFIIVDATNNSLAYCNELYNFGKHHGFTPYTCELLPSAEICFGRNIHQRTLNDIEQIVRTWQSIPDLFLRLKVDEFLNESG